MNGNVQRSKNRNKNGNENRNLEGTSPNLDWYLNLIGDRNMTGALEPESTSSNKSINTSKNSVNSNVCVQAYPSIDPGQREQALANLDKCLKSNDKTCMLTKTVLGEILNEKDPFRLLTHYKGTKIDLDRLRQARDCIYNAYYAPMTNSSSVKKVDSWINNHSMKSLAKNQSEESYLKHFKRVNITNQEYIKFEKIQEAFDEFIKHVASTWEDDPEKLKDGCNVMLNPVDVFAKCPANAACVGRSGQYQVSQPPILMKQLTNMHEALATAHNNLTQALLQTQTELRDKYESNPNIDKKKLGKLLDKLLNDKNPLMQVPSTRVVGSYDDNRKEMERLKKQRQRNQKDLIRRVVTEQGTIRNKYKTLFNLQKPVNLARRGATAKNSEGVVYTKYNRNERRGELQLRLKIKKLDEELKESNDEKKTQLISEMIGIQNLNKPLKLRKDERQGITVAKGGNRKQRDIVLLFGIKEHKDKNGKQKYRFTHESVFKLTKAFGMHNSNPNNQNQEELFFERLIQDSININTKTKKNTNSNANSNANSNTNVNSNANANVNRFIELMTFDMKHVDAVIRRLFLTCLAHKLKSLKKDEFNIGEFARYEMIDIPFLKQYRLTSAKKNYIFEKSTAVAPSNALRINELNMNYASFKLKQVATSNVYPRLGGVESVHKLEYMMIGNQAFIDYSSAVMQARQKVRANPKLLLSNSNQVNNIARFYLRNEDKHRMDGIRKILNLLNITNPENKKKKVSTKPKKLREMTPTKTNNQVRYVRDGILSKSRKPGRDNRRGSDNTSA